MKIGTSCLTYNRPEHLAFWTKQVAEFSQPDSVFHIANDSRDRKGVAFRSTECIRDLYNAGCDYMFIFNDDCFPIKQGWEQTFIDAHLASGQHHFIYLHETPSVKKISTLFAIEDKSETLGKIEAAGGKAFAIPTKIIPINIYDNCLGVMLFITREVVEKVGAFSPNFGLYGFEHAQYSNRISAAGLSPVGRYTCPAGAEEYIYSLDIDNSRPELHKKLKHKGSMSAREAILHTQKNFPVYQRDTQIYYPL